MYLCESSSSPRRRSLVSLPDATASGFFFPFSALAGLPPSFVGDKVLAFDLSSVA